MTFISVEATRTSGSVLTTMMAVLEVKEPTKAEKVLLLMCMDSGWLWLRPHDSLNCLMMLEIFSKRCTSWCCFRLHWAITRTVTRSNKTTCTASCYNSASLQKLFSMPC